MVLQQSLEYPRQHKRIRACRGERTHGSAGFLGYSPAWFWKGVRHLDYVFCFFDLLLSSCAPAPRPAPTTADIRSLCREGALFILPHRLDPTIPTAPPPKAAVPVCRSLLVCLDCSEIALFCSAMAFRLSFWYFAFLFLSGPLNKWLPLTHPSRLQSPAVADSTGGTGPPADPAWVLCTGPGCLWCSRGSPLVQGAAPYG